MSPSIISPFLCSISHPQDWEVASTFLEHLREKHSLYYFSTHDTTAEEWEPLLTHPFASLTTVFVSGAGVVNSATLEQLLMSQVGREKALPLIPIFLEDVPITGGQEEKRLLQSEDGKTSLEISDSFRALAGKMYEKITTLPVAGSYDNVSPSTLTQWNAFLEEEKAPLTPPLCYLMFREIIHSLNCNFIYLKFYSKESLPDFLEDFHLRIRNTVSGGRRPYQHARPITNQEIPDYFGTYSLTPQDFANFHPLTQEECVIEGGLLVSVTCDAPHIVIPFSLREIGAHAFAYNTTLEVLLLPEGILSIGDSCFDCCTNLHHLFLPNSLKTIGSSAFYSCISLQELFIPHSVQTLAPYTFCSCINLRKVSLPHSLTSIEKHCFELCCHLGDIPFPPNLKRIGARAFVGAGMDQVDFPLGLVHVEEEAFGSCCFLQRLRINPNLEVLDEHVFFNCYGLSAVEIPVPNRFRQISETALGSAGPFQVFEYSV